MSSRPRYPRPARTVLLLGAVVALGAWDSVPSQHGPGKQAPWCGAVPIAKPSGLCHGPAALGPAIPARMARDPAVVDTATGSRMVDCFAWQSFAALNWPASAACRGAPARGHDAASDWTSDRVWETYKEPYELFQATDTSWDPAEVRFDDPAPAGACDLETAHKILRHGAKFPVGAPLVFEDSQAFLPGAVLVDQQGNAV